MTRKITALVTLVKTWVEIESKYATKTKRREGFQNWGEINDKEKHSVETKGFREQYSRSLRVK